MISSRKTVESTPSPRPDESVPDAPSSLARRLGLFDATMIVMGGIIGSGIFMNPSEVAREINTAPLILVAWAAGGLVALAGAFVYAELAARRPQVGGQYAYIREAYHPAVAFVYGWALLLVIQSGGMAAVAITFARYFKELTALSTQEWLVAALALALVTAVNCLGVRAGSSLQSSLMVLKIVAIVGLIVCGLFVSSPSPAIGVIQQTGLQQTGGPQTATGGWQLLAAFGAAMVPVLFAYGGWQTANFIAGEVREPRKNLPLGLLLGVTGVTTLYLAVNFVCVRALGPEGLAATETPASEVMRRAFGETGARMIAVGIAVSTLGFLSQAILTTPRVYFAMAQDKLFFKSVSWLDPRTRVPVVAIALQGLLAMVIACSGKYKQILSYVVSVDFIFFGLTATCIFIFRRRDAKAAAASESSSVRYKMPGHPITTGLFIAVCWVVVANTVYKHPSNTWIGLAIMLAGIPAYFFWRWRRRAS
jgi:APA family basic amino acid/polyamine antiporter